MHTARLLIVSALLLSACGSTLSDIAGGSVGDNDWVLEGVSPDGKHLLVSTLFGGVASDCNRFEGWEVEQSDGSVEIKAQLWSRRAPSGCTDEGVVEVFQVDLDEPLADRRLVGCGIDDCVETVASGGQLSAGQIAVAGTSIAVAGVSRLEAYDMAGQQTAMVPGFSSGELFSLPGDAIVRNDEIGAVAIDLQTGTELWRTKGRATAATDDVVYVCRGQDSDGLAAVDASSGEDLWATDLVCEPLVSHGERLTVVAYDPKVDGGHRLLVVDATAGDVLVDDAFLDGYDDQVNAFDGAVAVGSKTITTGPQANLVVLADDGTELARQSRGLGFPLGEADGVAVIGDHNSLVGFDPETMSELWSLGVDAFSTIEVANGSVWSLDRLNGTVSRLNPATGLPRWTTEVGVSSSVDVAADTTTTYIVTTQGLVAVDSESGDVRWSQHRPYDGGGR